MEKSLTLDGKTARKIYPTASPEIKEILEKNFTKEFFSQSIKDRINSWEDIADEFGIDPVKSLPYPNPLDETCFPVFTYTDGSKSDPIADKKHINACFKMTLLTRLFNGGKINYDDGSQAKHWGWGRKRPAGFGFDHVGTRYDGTNTTVGPRLSFLKEEDVRHVWSHPELSKILIDYYEQ